MRRMRTAGKKMATATEKGFKLRAVIETQASEGCAPNGIYRTITTVYGDACVDGAARMWVRTVKDDIPATANLLHHARS